MPESVCFDDDENTYVSMEYITMLSRILFFFFARERKGRNQSVGYIGPQMVDVDDKRVRPTRGAYVSARKSNCREASRTREPRCARL